MKTSKTYDNLGTITPNTNTNTQYSAHSEADIADMPDKERRIIRKHLLQESDRYKNIKCVKNGRKGMLTARDNARLSESERLKYEKDIVPELEGKVDCLQMKVRYLEGSLYVSEQKIGNITKETSNPYDYIRELERENEVKSLRLACYQGYNPLSDTDTDTDDDDEGKDVIDAVTDLRED